MTSPENLSTPKSFTVPRALTPNELGCAMKVADALIPATATAPSASAEPEFSTTLGTALHARADAFDTFTQWMVDLADVEGVALFDRLRDLNDSDPDAFQAVSAILAGAWVLTPTVRARIGYPGQQRNPPSLTEAVDQLEDGLLDAVMERGEIFIPTPDSAPTETWAQLHPEFVEGDVRVEH